MSRPPLGSPSSPSRRRPPRLAAGLLPLLGALALLTACADDPIAPAVAPTEPPAASAGRVLGVVEVTLSGLGTGDLHASARPVVPGRLGGAEPDTAASGLNLALSPPSGTASGTGDGTIQLEPVSTGSFTEGVRGSGGERYLSATFRVRNAQVDGTPYTTSRQNLTFLAVSTASTIDETAISTLRRFDGSPADPAIALQVLPTGAAMQGPSGELDARFADVLQVLTESEAAAVAAPAGVTSVFPYGFVVRNPSTSNSRTLSASPAAGQFDGVVTFAFKIPLQASATEDPFTISALFLAVDDDQTRVTQSLEEQDSSAEAAFAARTTALVTSEATLLPGSRYDGPLPMRRVCTPVRTAGPAAAPVATLFPDPPVFVALAPDPYTGAAHVLPNATTLAATLNEPITQADAGSFVVTGSQSGGHFGGETYAGVGTPTVTTPSATFFPGELVEVTLTNRLGLCEPRVARYVAAAAGGSGSFTSTDTLNLSFHPGSIAAADLDGDGDVDLAVPAENVGSVVLVQNDGAGNFPSRDTVAVGSGPISVVAADLDGDGDLDLATANNGSSDVTILQNDGTASFTPMDTVAVGLQPESITAADLDGDGDLDLATANTIADNVSILKNDGTGAFTNVGTVSPGNDPGAIAAADLDRDGDVDLAVADRSSASVSILQNDGAGRFPSRGTVPVGSSPLFVVAADLDGDGDVDLATSNSSSSTAISIFKNDGAGGFVDGGTLEGGDELLAVTAADLDGDDDVDLVLATQSTIGLPGTVSIYRNDGMGSFTADTGAVTVSVQPSVLTTADLDGDGDLDLAVANILDSTLWILTNQ